MATTHMETICATLDTAARQTHLVDRDARSATRSRAEEESVRIPFIYYVRLVRDPKRKSKYVVRQWHGVGQAFQSLDELKTLLQHAFPDDLPAMTSDFYVGYFEPPSGAKRWIIDDRDLGSLYASCAPGLKINLWCEPKLPDEHADDVCSSSQPSPKKKKGESLESETDVIFEQLRKKTL